MRVTGIKKSNKQVSSVTRAHNHHVNERILLSISKEVTGITTEQGDITCEYVVNCGGMWAKQIGWHPILLNPYASLQMVLMEYCLSTGRMAGVNVPLHTCEHFYIATKPMPGVDTSTIVPRLLLLAPR